MASSLGAIACTARREGRLEEALEHALHQVALARSQASRRDVCFALLLQAAVCVEMGDAQAIQLYEEALCLARDIEFVHAEFACLTNLGRAYLQAGRHDVVRRAVEAALPLAALDHDRGEAEGLLAACPGLNHLSAAAHLRVARKAVPSPDAELWCLWMPALRVLGGWEDAGAAASGGRRPGAACLRSRHLSGRAGAWPLAHARRFPAAAHPLRQRAASLMPA